MIINPYRFASGSSVLLQDTFTGAAADLEAHSPEVGGAWVEGADADGTHFDLDGSGALKLTNGGGVYSIATVDCGAADVVCALVFTATAGTGNNFGPCLNFVDTDNWWVCSSNSGNVNIQEMTAATFTTRSSASFGGSIQGETLTVTTSGDSISWESSLGGSGSYSVGSRANQTATRHGVYGFFSAANAFADSIEVTG